MKRHRPTEPNDIKMLRGQKGGEHAAEEKVCHSVPLVLQLHRSGRGPGQLTGISTQTNWKKETKKKSCERNQNQVCNHWSRVTHVVTHMGGDPTHPPTKSIYPFTRPFIHSITNQTHLQSLPPALTTNLSSQENRTLVT